MLVEMKLKTSASFRSLALGFSIMISKLKLCDSSPTHTTIIIGLKK